MTDEATLDYFEGENSAGESRSLTLEERLLAPISPSIGLRVIPGREDPLYLQNRGTELLQGVFRALTGKVCSSIRSQAVFALDILQLGDQFRIPCDVDDIAGDVLCRPGHERFAPET